MREWERVGEGSKRLRGGKLAASGVKKVGLVKE
jgi:hypothetical protein